MTITNISWRVLAIFAGLVATTVDGWNNLSYVVNAGLTHDVIAAVATASFIMAIGLPVSVRGFRQGCYFSAGIGLLAFAIACYTSYGYSLNRMGHNRANEVHNIDKANTSSMLAMSRLARAEKKLEAAEEALATESVTGKGPRWKKAYAQREQALEAHNKATEDVKKIGPMKHVKTVPQTDYVVYTLPLMLQLASVAFFGIGFGRSKTHGDGGQPAQPDQPNTPKISRVHSQKWIDQMKTGVQSVQNTEHSESKEKSVFQAIQKLAENGKLETSYRALADNSEASTGSMNEALNSLQAQGLIKRTLNNKRHGQHITILNTEHSFCASDAHKASALEHSFA